MEPENRDSETGRGHESSFSLTRQAQTNHYDRRMTDLVKHDSRSLDKINTREAGLRVLTNDISIGALTSPDSRVPTLLDNYITLIICEVAVQKCLRDGGRGKISRSRRSATSPPMTGG